MIKIAVGGQFIKNEIAEEIKRLGGDKVDVVVKGDLDAAKTVKKGNAAYYFGACATGGGGSLAMAIAMLGTTKCLTVAAPSKLATEEEMRRAVADGKIAFGFISDAHKYVLGVLIPEILKKAEA
jgi:hypothetical protein